MSRIMKFFDKFEDKVRAALSHHPMIYATIGGVGVVSFWRGVWEVSTDLRIPPIASLVGGLIIMMSIGIMVTEFLGNRILLSGLTGKKKIEEKTIEEIKEEEGRLSLLQEKVDHIEELLEKK